MSKQPLADQLDLAISRLIAGESRGAEDQALGDLVLLAADLVDLPRPEFRASVRGDLERRISMSSHASVEKDSAVRPQFRTITPYIVSTRADEVIDFMRKVFDGKETSRASTSPGAFHAEVRIGDSMLMVGKAPDDYEGPSWNAELQVYVEDADDVYMRAINAGAESLSEVIEGHGDRFGCVQDPFGNRWIISTQLGAQYVPEHLHTVTPWLHADGASQLIDFMKEAFGAEELERHDSDDGKVLHAKIRIGDSVIQSSEGAGWWQPVPTMIHMSVPDVDAAYERAVRAGAKSGNPPTDQPYGVRSAMVEDPFGNQWHPSTPIAGVDE